MKLRIKQYNNIFTDGFSILFLLGIFLNCLFILTRNTFSLTSFCSVHDLHLIFFLSNRFLWKAISSGLHAEDSFLYKFLGNVKENIMDSFNWSFKCSIVIVVADMGLYTLPFITPHKKSLRGLDTQTVSDQQSWYWPAEFLPSENL